MPIKSRRKPSKVSAKDVNEALKKEKDKEKIKPVEEKMEEEPVKEKMEEDTPKTEIKVNGNHSSPKTNGARGRKRTRESSIDSEAKKPKVSLVRPNIENGVLLTLGMGDVGQLGLGEDVEERVRPAAVSDVKDAVSICAGGLHTMCLTAQGKVYTWGCNDEGALGRVTKVEEDNFLVKEVDLPDNIVAITAGDCHSAALTSDGKVYAWGTFRDNSGPLGFMEKGNIQKTPRQILEDIPVVKMTSGHSHLVLLTQTGHLYTCGNGESGQLGRIASQFACRDSRNRNGIESLLSPRIIKVYSSRKQVLFEDVWAGGLATLAKARDTGHIYGFGLNNYCQLGDEDTNMKYHPTLLKAFHGKDWKMVACGLHHSLALDSEGKVYSMGRKEYGRLGLGKDCPDATVPTLIKSLLDKKCTSISAGENISLVVSDEGDGYAFGMGTSNQLGQGDDEDRWDPSIISGKQLSNKKVIDLSAGGQHTVILAKTVE